MKQRGVGALSCVADNTATGGRYGHAGKRLRAGLNHHTAWLEKAPARERRVAGP